MASATGTGLTVTPGGMLGAGLGSALLGGILGGSARVSSPYLGQIQQGAGMQMGMGSNLYGIGSNYLNQAQSFTPQYMNSVQNYMTAMNQNPYTDTYSAGQISNMLGNTNQAYAQQQAQLTSQLAAQGMAQPGGYSSPLAGADAGFAAARAGSLAGAQNQLANQAIGQRYQNLQNSMNAGQSAANNLYGWGMGGAQAGAGIYGQGVNSMLDLNQQYMNAQAQASNAASGLGSGIGSLIGMGGGMMGI